MTQQIQPAFAYALPSGRVEVSLSRRLDYEMTDDHVRLDCDVSRNLDSTKRVRAYVDGWYVYERDQS